MKHLRFSCVLVTVLFVLAGCAKAPSEGYIQTAIVQTAIAQASITETLQAMITELPPTATTEPINTPIPTRTPLPTNTPQNQPGSRSNPFGLGEPGLFTKDESKKFTFAVVEVLSGDDAYQKIMSANMFNDPAPEGFEYLVIKVSVNYLEGSSPDDLLEISSSWLDDFQMGIVSNNKIITESEHVVEPKPEFSFKMFPGSQSEGYEVLLFEKGDENPVLFFGLDNGAVQYFSLK